MQALPEESLPKDFKAYFENLQTTFQQLQNHKKYNAAMASFYQGVGHMCREFGFANDLMKGRKAEKCIKASSDSMQITAETLADRNVARKARRKAKKLSGASTNPSLSSSSVAAGVDIETLPEEP